MSSARLFWLSGLALIIGGLISITGHWLHPNGHEIEHLLLPTYALSHGLGLLGAVLYTFGMPGLYVRLAARLGVLGLIGFVFFQIGTITSIIVGGHDIYTQPFLAANPTTQALVAPGGALVGAFGASPLGGLLGLISLIGQILFGGLLLRSDFAGRWAGLLLLLFQPIFILTVVLSGGQDSYTVLLKSILSFFELAYVWLGYVLLMDQFPESQALTTTGKSQPVVGG
jgi:hypothetical protein